MTKASYIPPGTVWWTACEAFTWAAFRDARKLCWWDEDGNERWTESVEFPASKWAVDWKQPPCTGLSRAFIALATGRRWTPEEWGSRGRAHYLGWAWAIMRDTEVIIRDPDKSAEHLHALLAEHNEQHARNKDKLHQAWRDVMAKVRAGQVTVRARRTLQNGKPDISALPEILDPIRVFGPLAIGLGGNVDYAGGKSGGGITTTPLEALVDYKGPRWDEAEFVAGQVQAIWLAKPSIVAAQATAVGEIRLQTWLVEKMRAAPNAPTAKMGMKELAKVAGHAFSDVGFDRAWGSAVKRTGLAAWSAPGRKPKLREM